MTVSSAICISGEGDTDCGCRDVDHDNCGGDCGCDDVDHDNYGDDSDCSFF